VQVSKRDIPPTGKEKFGKAYLQHFGKYVFLHHSVMHSDRTTTNLDSIQDQIVVLAAYLDDAWNRTASHAYARTTSAITAVTVHRKKADLGEATIIERL
jgi:hypothetical protein